MNGEDYVLTDKEFNQLPKLRYLEVRSGRLARNFKKVLPNIRWLRLYYCDFFLTGLNLKKMVVLECEDCSVKDGWREWNQIKVAQKLKVLNLSWCANLEKVPDLSNCRGLELLHFRGCRSMHGELDIRNLTHLKVLGVGKTNITKLKGEIGKLQNLQNIDVSHTRLIELPAGISELSSLEFLDLTLTDPNKPHLSETLPGSLKSLAISSSSLPVLPSSLNFLDICYCEHLKRLPSLANLTNLTGLHLKKVGVREIPGLGELKLLETLYIR
ncbi:Disease resistance protein RUN1 [Linum perenne]